MRREAIDIYSNEIGGICMEKMNHKTAIKHLRNSDISERDPIFREAICALEKSLMESEDVKMLENIYLNVKDLMLRKQILKCLFDNNAWELKQFFLSAYKRERYLDMKMDAIRGYANYASEFEVSKLMEGFIKTLKKRPESTPCNYQEYEMLRAACGLPYLIKKYGYSCFVEAYEQEEKQYNDMPDAFKGYFTFNEAGEYIELKTPEESKRLMDDFFEANWRK